ncbi:hypothetical protein G4B88_009187 [Cannabis sativa]|uniref:GDSL esterase/lipase n=3 Tax=Cannabis sativa TaxID=3483 RepID=A0AB40ECZ0_CANSA|nr:hypothetical protein G4B88_009187 [Cannabis sativa]
MALSLSSSSILILFLITISLFPYSSKCNNNNFDDKNKNKMLIMKGMFVFGSSLVDNGNNNFINNSLAKANYLPYGLDFPLGPSGRFTNGKNVIDLIGEKLRLPFIPAFADPSTKGRRIVHGVSFASGGSGILDDTGSIAGNVISLRKQIRNFEKVTLPDLEGEIGCKGKKNLKDYLFVVGSGSNDYSFNYFLTGLNHKITLQDFTTNLTISLSHHLKKLYRLGGRKFVLMSINPIGCSPMVRTMVQHSTPTQNRNRNQNRCIQGLNIAAQLFNNHLKSLVDTMKPQMPGSALLYVNSYKIIRDIIRNPFQKGFKEASKPCCKVATLSEGGNGVLCKREGSVCGNRSNHVFFDGLHPTEAVNIQIANKAFASTLPTEVYPINIQQLLQLQTTY